MNGAKEIKFCVECVETLWEKVKAKGFSAGLFHIDIEKRFNQCFYVHVCTTCLLKTLWERRYCYYKQFFLFPQCFLNPF